VSKFNPAGNFNITINEPTTEIEKVYIQGSDKIDNKLIWEKE